MLSEDVQVYRTRDGRPGEIRPRQDPVVYGGAEDGPLTAAELDGYQRNGFHTFDQLLTAEEVRECREEVARLVQRPERYTDERYIVEPAADEVRSIFQVHAVSPLFDRIIKDSRLVLVARQLLGSEVYIHQTRINAKPAFTGSGFYWHSDFETWHAEDGMPRVRALSFSIGLTENYPHNGPLMIIPGSHQWFVSSAAPTPPENHKSSLGKQEVGVPEEEILHRIAEDNGGVHQVVGAPGSAVAFDCNCMHGSAENITPYPRANLFVVFNSVHNTLVEPFAAPARRPEYLADRTFTPLG
ncbi:MULTISPECIES: ectoine hydroxylase [unclassified Crossiella]|uniref:ectoine hydroxylase n=1 Tax=unclassified Crossiella TaxID=2620835 RepID=UPI001FFFE1CA|nr:MULTISPECIES: ectoine hydroxylase [unclassified Crossiella]MCK2244130.1 ectoine hydroxylase [Crossiella sp. S99.2]MCK2257934.1 ectoine hydroxylase [Crossiella sp. S99.1]